jgi:hypothetical protein
VKAKLSGALGRVLPALPALLIMVMIALAPVSGLADTFSLNPVADQMVHYENTNMGTRDFIFVNSYENQYRSFLRFDLSTIPDTYQISQAVLHLYRYEHTQNNYTLIDLHHVASDSWTEGGITWNNAPAYGAQLGAKTILYTDPQAAWTTFDLFGIAGWDWSADLSDDAVSLMLKLNNESEYGRYAAFWSKEHLSLIPSLEITANAVPLPGAVLLLGAGMARLVAYARRRKSLTA